VSSSSLPFGSPARCPSSLLTEVPWLTRSGIRGLRRTERAHVDRRFHAVDLMTDAFVFLLVQSPAATVMNAAALAADDRVYLQSLYSALPPSALLRAIYPVLSSYKTPDEEVTHDPTHPVFTMQGRRNIPLHTHWCTCLTSLIHRNPTSDLLHSIEGDAPEPAENPANDSREPHEAIPGFGYGWKEMKPWIGSIAFTETGLDGSIGVAMLSHTGIPPAFAVPSGAHHLRLAHLPAGHVHVHHRLLRAARAGGAAVPAATGEANYGGQAIDTQAEQLNPSTPVACHGA
jgi:hypothetical protein